MSATEHVADNIVGNHFDEFGTRNPIARALMRGLLSATGDLYARTRPRSVLEVGCGEGLLAQHLLRTAILLGEPLR